jgi:hypothetical protein
MTQVNCLQLNIFIDAAVVVCEDNCCSKLNGEDKPRVARFFLVQNTKTGRNVPSEYKMYQMVIKYP